MIGPLREGTNTPRALIQVRLIPNDHLDLVIEGGPEDDRFDVRIVVNGDPNSHHILASPTGGLPVTRRAFPTYYFFDRLLTEIAQEPKQVERHVNAGVARMIHEHGGIYPAYVGLLAEVLAHRDDEDRMRHEAISLRTRLYDGPVVGAYGRHTLEKFLSSEDAYLSFAAGLNIYQRADMARLRMSLERLEARESISGFYDSPAQARAGVSAAAPSPVSQPSHSR